MELSSFQLATLRKITEVVSEKPLEDIVRDNGMAVLLSPAVCAGLMSMFPPNVDDPEFNTLEQLRKADKELRSLWLASKQCTINNAVSYIATAVSILEGITNEQQNRFGKLELD